MSVVYLDGQYRPAEDVRFGPTLFSLNYAVCAFEGIRCYATARGPSVFRLRDHLSRYVRTCRYLGFENAALSEDAQHDAVVGLVRRSAPGDLYIRPIAFVDEGIMNLSDHPAVRSAVFAMPFSPAASAPVIRLGVSAHRRSTDTIAQKISRNYFDPYMGLKRKGPDVDDLLYLDRDGLVTETSAHNVFFIGPSGAVATPRTTHCLPGITRDTVIDLLRRRDVDVVEKDIDAAEIGSFAAAFTTSTASEIRIVRGIAEHRLDPEHAVLRTLIEDFKRCVSGLDHHKEEWNSYV